MNYIAHPSVLVPSGYVFDGRLADLSALLAHAILCKTVAFRRERPYCWIRFGSAELRRTVGGNYSDVLNLLDGRLIERDHSFSIGRRSKRLRLLRSYRRGGWCAYRLSRRRRVPSDVKAADDVSRWLVSHFDRFILPPSPFKWNSWIEYSAHRIRTKRYYAMRCRHGRFHSCFTSLKRELRATLLVDGQDDSVEIDVANAQPLLLAILARDAGYVDPEFLDLCERGEIYEHLQFRTGWSRSRTKKAFLVMLFDRMHPSEFWDMFRREFPAVAEFTVETKRPDHWQLAHLCQRRESELMIDGVCKVAMQTLPDVPLLTVHDSIVCSAKHESSIREIMATEFHKQGVKATIPQKEKV